MLSVSGSFVGLVIGSGLVVGAVVGVVVVVHVVVGVFVGVSVGVVASETPLEHHMIVGEPTEHTFRADHSIKAARRRLAFRLRTGIASSYLAQK